MRGFQIDDHVDTIIVKGKILGVSLQKREAIDRIVLPAKLNCFFGKVDPLHRSRPQITSDVRRAAAAAGSNFDHVLSAQVNRRGHVVIQLYAITVCLLSVLERDRTWRRIKTGIAVIHEGDVAFAIQHDESFVPTLHHEAAEFWGNAGRHIKGSSQHSYFSTGRVQRNLYSSAIKLAPLAGAVCLSSFRYIVPKT